MTLKMVPKAIEIVESKMSLPKKASGGKALNGTENSYLHIRN